MNRIKYEQYHGAAGYDAVARRKIKELEKKVGPQIVEKVLLDEPEAVFVESDGVLNAYYPVSSQIKPGQNYNVEIDGNKYSCVAESAEGEEGFAFTALGNLRLDPYIGENFPDTGEPFAVAAADFGEGYGLQIIIAAPATYAAPTTRTFSVKISTMEEKASGGGMFVVNATPTGSTTSTLDKTYQEIQTAYDSGAWVVLKVVGAPMLLTLQTPVAGMPALFAHYMPAPDGTITFNTLTVSPDDTVEIASYIVTAAKPN